MTVDILHGDCRDVLATLPADSVHCVVTSPPYWGLRDYGVAGQIGLEPTIAEYVAEMVTVFREVRRVLREDGTLFLNLGDSYFGGGRGGGGSFEARRPGWRDVPYGTCGKAQSDFLRNDRTSQNLCDGCRAALMGDRNPHNGRSRVCEPLPSPCSSSPAHMESERARPPTSDCSAQADRIADATQDYLQQSFPAGEQPHVSAMAMPLQSSPPHLAECSHCDNCGACLAVLASSSRDVRLCARKAADRDTGGTIDISRPLPGRSSSDLVSSAYPHSTTQFLKPKDLCGVPWRVALALQADAWWLRQDIIWSKPNPMPESVTDRCTKAHEYLFLLSKGPRYYFDAEAIKEAAEYGRRDTAGEWRGGAYVNQRGPQSNSEGNGGRNSVTGRHPETGRNKRSVWTVATSPFPEAHFATFPPALIEPCIKAGCPKGGMVLDPFGGAGTTGLVADRLQCNAILIEKNPDYVAMAERRIRGDAPLFAIAT